MICQQIDLIRALKVFYLDTCKPFSNGRFFEPCHLRSVGEKMVKILEYFIGNFPKLYHRDKACMQALNFHIFIHVNYKSVVKNNHILDRLGVCWIERSSEHRTC